MARERVLDRMRQDAFLGVHLALNIFVGSLLLWLILRVMVGVNPIWAIASLVAASDPQVKQAIANFRARLCNGVVGCLVGLAFLAIGGASEWTLPFAMGVSALVSAYIVRIPTMWRQGPITAALVIASAAAGHSSLTGFEIGLRRVAEVILGCVVGALVSWLMSRIWHVPAKPAK